MHAVYTRDASDNITLTVLGCCQIGGIQEKKNITFFKSALFTFNVSPNDVVYVE